MGQHRHTNSISVQAEGRAIFRTRLSKKGWNISTWADLSFVSQSTAKRLLAGKAIKYDCLIALMNELDLKLEDVYVSRHLPVSTKSIEVQQQQPDIVSTSSYCGVLMTGQYTEGQKSHVQRAVEHLRTLMVEAQFTYEDHDGAIMVTGEFLPENESQIRMVIARLEKLLTASHVTW
jgi:lambda repressor-like predicted transcriptional regulator